MMEAIYFLTCPTQHCACATAEDYGMGNLKYLWRLIIRSIYVNWKDYKVP
jgi:hypothetical protein